MTQQDNNYIPPLYKYNSEDGSIELADAYTHALAAAELVGFVKKIAKPSVMSDKHPLVEYSEWVAEADTLLTKHAPTITQGQKLKRLVDAAVAWYSIYSENFSGSLAESQLKEAVADWKGE